VVSSHVSKRHIVRHECERKCLSYSATLDSELGVALLSHSATFDVFCVDVRLGFSFCELFRGFRFMFIKD
jgi:hypothetical protein